MKNLFFEYYPIEKVEIDRIWNDGIFCYDANVLLNIYRYTEETRSNIFSNIEHFISRSILPYQACYEYQKNKRVVVDSLRGSYDKIIKVLNAVESNVKSGDLNKYRKHCALDIEKDVINPIEKTIVKVIKKIEKSKDIHSTFINEDNIHTKITNLFTNRISEEITEDVLKKIYAEGKNRYEKLIPPGFADAKNKSNSPENNLYGDLIIWKHLIEIAKKEDKDVIFITDDRKNDWWDNYNGQTKGALPQLFKEFRKMSNHNILIYTVEDFMKYAPEHSGIKAPKKVVSEIENLRKIDINRYDYSKLNETIAKLNSQTTLFRDILAKSSVLEQFNEQNDIMQKILSTHPSIKQFNNLSEMMNAMKFLDQTQAIKSYLSQPNSESTPEYLELPPDVDVEIQE